jgi:hypothetical protein
MDEPLPPVPVPAQDAPAEVPFAQVAGASNAWPVTQPPQIPEADVPFATATVEGYRYSPEFRRRPGLVTAIGVLAIVVACLSGLGNVIGGGYTVLFYFLSNLPANFGNFANFPPRNGAPPHAVQTGPLSVADAGVATGVLQEQLALDGPRQQELSELLRKHGAAIFQVDDNAALTPATVKDLTSESHKAEGNTDSAARFGTPAGVVEIYSDHTTFTSTDGATTIRTSAKDHSDSVNAGTAATTEPSPAATTILQPGEISRAIATIRQMSNVPVTPGQIAAIRRELSNPNQTLVISGGPTLVYSVISLPPNNNLQIGFNSGTLTLDSTGRVTSLISTTQFQKPFPFKMPASWTIVVVVECAVSALLAIYLFIIGIVVLRGSLSSPRLLRIYAYPKILLALTSGVSMVFLIFTSAATVAAQIAAGAQVSAYMAGASLLIGGIAFPIGILIALRSRSVKTYYSAADTSRV